jgi:hypothetical protein
MRDGATWGDGFADDSWEAVAQVRDWSVLAPEEYVRLFPSLVPQVAQIPAPVAAVVRARISTFSAAPDVTEDGTRGHTGSAGTISEAQFLSWVISSSDSERARCNERDWARFGYWSNVHPAYVWPAASCLASWGATAAWLGALGRCGRALMPIEVAEYISDMATVDAFGRTTIRDALLVDYVQRTAAPSDLLHAAQRRLQGVSVEVCRRSDAPSASWRWRPHWPFGGGFPATPRPSRSAGARAR